MSILMLWNSIQASTYYFEKYKLEVMVETIRIIRIMVLKNVNIMTVLIYLMFYDKGSYATIWKSTNT